MTADKRPGRSGRREAGRQSAGAEGLIRALGDLMEEELEAATDLQLTENITQMGLDEILVRGHLHHEAYESCGSRGPGGEDVEIKQQSSSPHASREPRLLRRELRRDYCSERRASMFA